MSEYEGIFIAFASTSDSEKERLELEFIVFECCVVDYT
jgi:hypothetical protein